MLGLALAEGTKSRGVHGPVDPSTSVKVFENAITFATFFTSFFSLLQLWLRVITSV